ncbi:MAG: hypothetical protein HQ592_12445, partial [Planctomycetes bacterium]|nr:hypothetical protein [Planctomycetota bacterium]
LQRAIEAIEESVEIYKRLNLPADLAMSLNNASNFYSKLADSAESDQQRRDYLQQAVEAIQEAIEIYKRLNLPANLALSLWTSASVWQALAAAEDDDQAEFAHRVRAAECIDEAISLLEQTGRNYRLVGGYPEGVRMHLTLLQQRPESVQRARIYAEKAAVLLKEYAKPEEAEQFAELARQLSGGQPD